MNKNESTFFLRNNNNQLARQKGHIFQITNDLI